MLCYGLVVMVMGPRPVVLSVMLDQPYPSRLPCVTLLRSYINLFTAIAILAVDFTIFPRRLAKTETFGTGLMDIGVGIFLVAHAISAPEARYPDRFKRWLSFQDYIWNGAQTLRLVAPLLVLGVLRLLAVKSTDYQEHITEYGVHWNFFFTIGTVRVCDCSGWHGDVV